MKKIILILALIPILTFAESGVLTLGKETVSYDAVFSTETGTLYYTGDTLVASEHKKVTILYKNDLPILEAHDTNNDGVADTFITLDSDGNTIDTTGPGADTFIRPETVEFSTLIADKNTDYTDASEEDLVGSLDSITIPRYRNFTLYVIILLLLTGGYYWYRRRK